MRDRPLHVELVYKTAVRCIEHVQRGDASALCIVAKSAETIGEDQISHVTRYRSLPQQQSCLLQALIWAHPRLLSSQSHSSTIQHSSHSLRVDATSSQSLQWGPRHLHSFMTDRPIIASKARPIAGSTRGLRPRQAGLNQPKRPSRKGPW